MEKLKTCYELASELVGRLKEQGLYLTAVESCTGGGFANCITNVSGSSEVFKGSFVTYSNDEKIKMGVTESLIESCTVYSEQVALAMANAGLLASDLATVSVGITGSLNRADPHNPKSKVGDVYLGVVVGSREMSCSLQLGEQHSTRAEAKEVIIEAALRQILLLLP